MPQVFPPSSNTLAKASIFGAGFLIIFLIYALTTFVRSPFTTKVNVPIEQPVPFSHEHHLNFGIDCRYCHKSVETSSFADIPPIETCMTCHSQIWLDSPVLAPVRNSYQNKVPLQWTRVNDLPDYVYFNHSIHVNKGFGCETCHGRVDQMPLTWKANTLYMSWCLNCHWNPAKYIRPKDQVFTMGYKPPQDQITMGNQLIKEYKIHSPSYLDDCYICHR